MKVQIGMPVDSLGFQTVVKYLHKSNPDRSLKVGLHRT